VAFFESEAGRWLSANLSAAYVSALRAATERMIQELVAVVPPERLVSAGFRKPPLPAPRR